MITLKIYTLALLMVLPVFSSAEQKEIKICVFCSADDKIPSDFKQLAFNLGAALGSHKSGLITGGSNTGLMKEVVDGYATTGLTDLVFGILPTLFKDYNIQHPAIPLRNLIWTETIHIRLATYAQLCDVIIVLPGGFGTLHEFMDFLVPVQFGIHKKTIILFNYKNFWDPLLQQFDTMIATNALQPKHKDIIKVANTIDSCLEIITDQIDKNSSFGLDSYYWQNK